MRNSIRQLWGIIGVEGPVMLFVVCGLLLGELAMRAGDAQLSKDVAHLKSFDWLAHRLEETAQHPSVLFLGNSMTRFGVAQGAFEDEFASRTGEVPLTVKMNPDNSSLSDWYYLYNNFIHDEDLKPDLMVVGFQGDHLRDQPPNHPGRLAQYYCDLNDWPDLCKYDLPTFEDRASFALASLSSLYGNHDRPQTRLFDALIPHYRDGVQQLIDRVNAHSLAPRPQPTYHRLKEFLKHVGEQKVELVMVAMPIAAEYELDPELLKILRESGVTLVDCRHVPGIVPAMFPDGIHMSADASELYSRYLADALADPRLAKRAAAQHATALGPALRSAPELAF
ncbi:hypothetical protein [Planctomicrobium piriforme]|uniref:GDSL-like Lipase/Acylhydrolase family protein n=1 Tax=Planctomicrobium piriforme TaxID=1576369 RepID=A0A1I3GY77_9PLAN|nr:hypothetical protein [Planctomicrobium piriforme]SFI28389.1 hypothetical protein SAMN05421753_107176 [Planctomicrobium piriforme]